MGNARHSAPDVPEPNGWLADRVRINGKIETYPKAPIVSTGRTSPSKRTGNILKFRNNCGGGKDAVPASFLPPNKLSRHGRLRLWDVCGVTADFLEKVVPFKLVTG
jgi:hypothetical protein